MANDEQILLQTVISNSKISEINEMPTKNSCSLKRKRPSSIKIPNVLREIPAEILKGTHKQQQQSDDAVCFADCGVGVFSLKGKKRFMEDAHKVFSSSFGTKAFFGVYDGHGGNKAAEYVAENLHLNIFETLENSSENQSKEEAVNAAYLKTDKDFLKQGFGSGSCCVTAVIEGQEMAVSNLGDCRAVLCRDGIAEALTTDHRPTREDERRRIEDKGGYVEFHRGTWRVHGTLAVSRSVGDAHLKDWVIAEPDTKVISLTKDMEFLVLASDGLWEEVSNQEAVDIVMSSCLGGNKKLVKSSPQIKDRVYPNPSISPLSRSPSASLVKSKRMIFRPTSHKVSTAPPKQSEELCYGNGSPPSKSRKISSRKKIKTHFPSNENEFLNEKPAYGDRLVAACKELANLAARRGSLDDITVMIVDLSRYNDQSLMLTKFMT